MRFSIALGLASYTIIGNAFKTLAAIGLPMLPTPMNPTLTAIGLSPLPSLAQRVLTILSHMSAYCCRYGGQIFSSATLRNEATSAWFTFMPLGSRTSFAFWKLSTDQGAYR